MIWRWVAAALVLLGVMSVEPVHGGCRFDNPYSACDRSTYGQSRSEHALTTARAKCTEALAALASDPVSRDAQEAFAQAYTERQRAHERVNAENEATRAEGSTP